MVKILILFSWSNIWKKWKISINDCKTYNTKSRSDHFDTCFYHQVFLFGANKIQSFSLIALSQLITSQNNRVIVLSAFDKLIIFSILQFNKWQIIYNFFRFRYQFQDINAWQEEVKSWQKYLSMDIFLYFAYHWELIILMRFNTPGK